MRSNLLQSTRRVPRWQCHALPGIRPPALFLFKMMNWKRGWLRRLTRNSDPSTSLRLCRTKGRAVHEDQLEVMRHASMRRQAGAQVLSPARIHEQRSVASLHVHFAGPAPSAWWGCRNRTVPHGRQWRAAAEGRTEAAKPVTGRRKGPREGTSEAAVRQPAAEAAAAVTSSTCGSMRRSTLRFICSAAL